MTPMFRKRDGQTSLLATSHFLPEDKRRRLERDWPGRFRTSALPLIDEEAFRELYHQWNGRPNKPVETIIGVLLLKEMNDLTDAEAVGALDYDLRWHVALDLEPEEAHCCQKTLHNFRAKLMESDKAKLLFEDMTGKIIEALGVRTERQRLDSTHITSNIARLTRLGLFCETARVFLRELRKESKRKFESIPEGLRRRYLKDDGKDTRYHDAKSSEAKRRIGVSARDVWRLADRFKGDEAVEALGSYGLLKRLLAEQCEVVKEPPSPRPGDATVHAAVLARRRRYEKTKEFKKRYAERAGIEATNSELKRAHGLGRLRIRGFLRVRLAVYFKALACNVKRMVKHLAGQARKAGNAAAAAVEGAEAAADAASCVILHLLRPRDPVLAPLVAS